MMIEPAAYHAWYQRPRGRWIGNTEFALLRRMLCAQDPLPRGCSLLDVGSGTGYFTRRFAQLGLAVTGLEPDEAMLGFARSHDKAATPAIRYLAGDALKLPFEDQHFDYVSAITSLCFVEPPDAALAEMWRVARRGVIAGLLNRHSLLYRRAHGRGAYRGARWDQARMLRRWVAQLDPAPARIELASCIFLPGGGVFARAFEPLVPSSCLYGGFLALRISRRP